MNLNNISLVIPVGPGLSGREKDSLTAWLAGGLWQYFGQTLVLTDGWFVTPDWLKNNGITARTIDWSPDTSRVQNPGLSIIGWSKNLGSGETRNRGARLAGRSRVFFLDSDVRLERSTLDSLAKLPEVSEKPGPRSGGESRVSSGAGSAPLAATQLIYGRPPEGALPGFFEQFKLAWIHQNYGNRARNLNWVFSACWLVDREWFLASGGYPPGSNADDAGDDIGLTKKLNRQNSGRPFSRFRPEVTGVRHEHRYGLRGLLRNDYRRARAQASEFLFRRNSSGRARLFHLPVTQGLSMILLGGFFPAVTLLMGVAVLARIFDFPGARGHDLFCSWPLLAGFWLAGGLLNIRLLFGLARGKWWYLPAGILFLPLNQLVLMAGALRGAREALRPD